MEPLISFDHIRKSNMQIDEVYFWTDTIYKWKNLWRPDKYKEVIIDTLSDLSHKRLINIYGFVIMPNHLHLIWELKGLNGKELPNASFNKATAHIIINNLKNNHPEVLEKFKVNEKERSYRIWQRDPLAVHMDSPGKLEQKLEYIHLNPFQEKWDLAKRPEDYYWSSASFYENGKDDFGFLKHYMDRM